MSNTRKATGAKKAPPPTPDIDTLLGEETRPEAVVPLCLRGNLRAEWDRLKAEYDAGPGDDDRSTLAARAAKRHVAEAMADVEAQMRAGTVEFRLRALPRRRTPGVAKDQMVWQELLERHPPRQDTNGKVDRRDAATGVNVATFFDELVRVSVVEPQLTDDQWGRLDAKLSDAQFNELASAAWNLNRVGVDVPFSRAASTMRRLDAELRRRNDSASPSDDSTGGNPEVSPSTSTTNTAG